MAYGTVNADVIGTSVAGSNLGAGNASIMKNRIINGAMVINQRALGTVTVNTSGTYTIDRWQANQTAAGKYTVQQSSTAPAGFKNSYLATSTSAYSVSSSDIFFFSQNIEGYNMADLAWGTADAKTVTLSAWVQSSLTGTFGGAIANATQTYCYPFSFSIPVANTWTKISVTITGATSGTWESTNGLGMQVIFGLGGGSGRSAPAGTWTTSGVYTADSCVSVVGTNGATFYITGVQLEVGSSATGYEYRQYGQELALCQRYFVKYLGNSAYEMPPNSLIAANTTNAYGYIGVPVQLRTLPSISGSNLRVDRIVSGTAASAIAIDSGYNSTISAGVNVTSSGLTSGLSYFVTANATTTAYIYISAEL